MTKSNHCAAKKLNPTLSVFLKAMIMQLVVYTVLFTTASTVCYMTDIDRKLYFYIAAFVSLLSNLLAAYYSGFKIHKNGLTVGLLFCLPMNLIILLISFLINSFHIDFTALIAFAVSEISAMLGGVLSVNTKVKPKKHK